MENYQAVVLRTARAVTGVSQRELARRVGIGQNRLCELERGHRRLRPEMAQRLWQALIVPQGSEKDGSPGA